MRLRLLGVFAGAAMLCLPQHQLGQSLPLDPSRIPAGAWTYEFWEGDVHVGDLYSVVNRQDDLLVSTSYLSLPGGRQEGTITLRASDLVPVHSHVVLIQGTGAFEARMRYGAGPDSLQVQRQVVRQAFPPGQALPLRSEWSVPRAGRYDMQELDLVIQALPLAEGAGWQVVVLDPTVDHPVSVSISVEGRGTSTTPAGSFDVWRVRARGLVTDMIYEFDVRDHRLVAQHAPSQGIRMLLKR